MKLRMVHYLQVSQASMFAYLQSSNIVGSLADESATQQRRESNDVSVIGCASSTFLLLRLRATILSDGVPTQHTMAVGNDE